MESLVENPFYEQEQLAILRADGKTPEVNNISKITTSSQEMSFLSNFSMSGPTDLVESSEDMMRAISSFLVGLKKKNFELFFSALKVFVRIFNVYFSLRSNGRKIIFENTSSFNWVCDCTIICI